MKGLDSSWSSPFSSALLLFTHSLSLSQPVDFAMLWSSCASRPSGYLDIAWSQSPVNQISSDLADPADKTLHGKRKWQTAGDTRPDYEGSVKRDWSQRSSNSKRLPRMKIYCLCLFIFSNLHWLNLIWTSLASACLFIWRKKIPVHTVLQVFSHKRMNGKGNIFENEWCFVEFCIVYTLLKPMLLGSSWSSIVIF